MAAELGGRAKPDLLVCNLGGDWLSQCRSGASVSYAVLVINRRTASTRAATAPSPRASKAPRKTPFPTQAELYAALTSSDVES